MRDLLKQLLCTPSKASPHVLMHALSLSLVTCMDRRLTPTQGFAKSMLDVADNLERALTTVPAEVLQQAPAGDEDKITSMLRSLLTGVEMTNRVLLQVGLHRQHHTPNEAWLSFWRAVVIGAARFSCAVASGCGTLRFLLLDIMCRFALVSLY